MIIILHGDESFLISKRLQELKHAYGKKIGDDFEYIVFEGEDAVFEKIKNTISGGTLFSTPRFISIKNTTENSDLKKQLSEYEYDDHVLNQKDLMVVFTENKNIKKDKDYIKLSKKASKVEEFNGLNTQNSAAWIKHYFKRRGINLEQGLIARVLNLCNGNLGTACNELEKITLYKGKTGSSLRATDAELLLLGVGAKEAQIFPAIDAIFGGNIDAALYHLQLHQEKGEAPQLVFGMVEKQLKNISLVKEQIQAGLNKDSIAKKTGLHPYVVQKTIPVANKFSWAKIKDLYQRVESLELRSKNGKIDAYLACELFSAAASS